MSEKIWKLSFDRFGHTFNYKLYRRPGKRLLVLFSALRPASINRLDFYNRLTWSNDFKCSLLYVTDPGLGDGIRGTWYQGNYQFFTIEKIAQDIKDICYEFDFDESQVVLYGSSQGGFAALAVGAYLPSSSVLAEGPQINLSNYDGVLDKELDTMARVCYSVNSSSKIPKEYSFRTNLIDLYSRKARIGGTYIIVRKNDLFHKEQADAFVTEHKKIFIEVHDDLTEKGHVAIEKEIIADRVIKIFAGR